MKVAVVDYGMGNLRSVVQALRRAALGTTECEVVLTSDSDEVGRADRIVLPGQGAMPDCMRALRESGLEAAVRQAARDKPVLGVCVGMQMMLSRSEEGPTDGLGLIEGDVRRFRLEGRLQPDGSRHKVPHIGWNQVAQGQVHALWANIPDGAHFYFVHSYHAVPLHAVHGVGSTTYGDRFTCAIARDNIFATQFHPEKSAEHGLALYRNFLHWAP